MIRILLAEDDRSMREYLARALPIDESFDAVVAMPLHWRRRLQRGFNQAELLASQIARKRNLPVLHAVRRVRATRTQTGLTNAKRRDNVRGAFRVESDKRPEIDGRRILLVDDVYTTGATVNECARALGASVSRRMPAAMTTARFNASRRGRDRRGPRSPPACPAASGSS